MSIDNGSIIMYSSALCGYCAAAKRLLKSKGLAFTEIDVLFHPARRKQMMELGQRRTVPQIWVGETHIGGYDDLRALDASGKFDALIESIDTTQSISRE